MTGDSNHDSGAALSIPCVKVDVCGRPRVIRKYVWYRTQKSFVLSKFEKHKAGFAEEIEEIVTRAPQKM